MIERPRHLATLEELLDRSPVVAVLGARQVGKTTLARAFGARQRDRVTFFDLERPRDLARLALAWLAALFDFQNGLGPGVMRARWVDPPVPLGQA